MIFDDLQTACSDLAGYCKLPPRPPYGRYTSLLEMGGREKGRSYWLTHYTAIDSLRDESPVLGPEGTISPSTMRLKKLLHLPKVESSEFELATMGRMYLLRWALPILFRLRCIDLFDDERLRQFQSQSRAKTLTYGICIDAAFALTIASLRPQSKAVSFISMTSARRSNIAGIKDMMGPLSARVPIQIYLSLNSSLEDLVRHINEVFASMIGFEHCAMKTLHTDGGLQNLRPQAVFSWNPPGNDLSYKRITCHDNAVAPTVLAYREDLSVPYAHDYGLLFEVYEHIGHVAICASWDGDRVSVDLIGQLAEDFRRFLMLIVKSRTLTLREALCESRKANRVGEMG